MLNPFRSGFCIFLFSLSAHAFAGAACPPFTEAQPSAEAILEAMSKAQDRGFLWHISKDGHTSYLYGTIHVAKPEWLVPGPKVMAALRAADTVALELDMSDGDILMRLDQGMAALHGEVLPEPLVQRLQQQAAAVCVPYESISKLTPEFQVTLLSLFAGRWEGLDSSFAIDSVLGGIGHGTAKEVLSLETPEAQLQVLQMGSRQKTFALVEAGLEDLETGRARAMLGLAAKAWSEADYRRMSRYEEWCKCLDSEIEREVMKRMLNERNPGLSESIDKLHTSGKRVFAAVGSLHMFGPMGLPALMEQRGYRVHRVDFAIR